MKSIVLIYLICVSSITCSWNETFGQTPDLSQYNIVWTSQSLNSGESMPCGGGDIGLNVWVEKGEIQFYLSRSGAFDENNVFPKSGRIRLKISPDPFEGGSFRQELRLKEGYVEIEGVKPGRRTIIKVWVDVFRPVVHVESESSAPVSVEATYETWRFADLEWTKPGQVWASLAFRDAPFHAVIRADSVGFEEDKVLWYHRNRDESLFDITVHQQGLDPVKNQLWNPLKDLTFGGMMKGENMMPAGTTSGKYADTEFKGWKLQSVKPSRKNHLRVFLHIGQSASQEAWEKGLAEIERESTLAQKTAAQKTQSWWNDFWNRSYIFINPDNPAANSAEWQVGRNYQLFRYQLGCNAYGKYPTKFNGGLFTYDPGYIDKNLPFTPDHRNWGGGTFTAQNQRLVYYPMFKSGDFDMLPSQLNFYLRALRNAEIRTEFYWGHKGTSFTEQLEQFGLPLATSYGWNRPENFPKGLEYNFWLEYLWDTQMEFCLMMLDVERFTGQDISEYIPFIESCLTFFDEHYQKEALSHGRQALDGEGRLILYPSTGAETYKMAYNSTSCIAGLQTVLTRLLELPDSYLPPEKRKHWEGMLKRIPAIAFREKDGHKTISPAWAWARINNQEIPQLYPVFPYGMYGIGKPDLEVAIDTWKYGTDNPNQKNHISWHQDAIFCARLGLTEEAAAITIKKLQDSPRRYPTFWGPGHDWVPDHNWGGSGMIGLQEMLMQTDGMKIYLFPAWPKKWDVNFKLSAAFQTTVEGVLKDGKLVTMKVTPESRAKDVEILLTSDLKQTNTTPSMEEVFDHPPVSTKPHVYWYWVSNNISKEGIRKDLEAMERIGIGGVKLAQIGYKDSPVGKVAMFSREWWECMSFALEEAARLGIEVNLFNSPGWSGTGGSWIKPQQAMRYLDIHEYRVRGPQKMIMQLPDYKSEERVQQSSLSFQYEIDKSKFKFQQVGVHAFPAPECSRKILSAKNSRITSVPGIEGAEAMFDDDEATKTSIYSNPVTIHLEAEDVFTARSLEIITADLPFRAWCKLEFLNEKGNWEKILSRIINRSETRIIASGFLPFAPVAESFPAVKSRKFRLTLSENENSPTQPSATKIEKREIGRIAEIKIGGMVRLNNYAEKQLANKAAYDKKPQSILLPDEEGLAVQGKKVLDLTSHVDANGLLTWDVPEGDWIILHSGMNQTGVQIHPVPSEEASGFSADVLNKEAIQTSFDAYIGKILKNIPPEKRKSLTKIVLDSYEQGSANWSDGFTQKFIAAFGYDPMPWTPVLKGYVVESPEKSDRFLWDLRRLVADQLPDNFTGTISQRSHENGLALWHEPYGGHGFPGEFFNLGKYTDVPAGEFWLTDKPGRDFPFCRAASSIASIYDRKIVSVEAFTSGSNYLYRMLPRDLKIPGDWGFAQGMNHFTLHVSVLQPNDDRPGINTWYGTEFNRNNNWFQDAESYIDYIRRISAFLQRGRRISDIAIYTGDEVPMDKPTLPCPLPQGFDLDFINYDALVNLAKTENNRLVLPSGASYKVLILPPILTMRPELLAKIEELVKSGLIVYGPRPEKSPSLKDFPECDKIVREIAGRLWGKIDGKKVMWNNYGKGKMVSGMSLSDFFVLAAVPPDLEMPSDFVYTHRKEDDTDIYFLSNQKNEHRKTEISFRIAGKQPEYWDPVTGESRILHCFTVKEGRTVIPMEFPQAGTCFVVFRKDPSLPDVNQKNFPGYTEVQSLSGKWNVTFTGNINAPFSRSFNQLTDWTLLNDKEVKYFCGKATYSINFTFGGRLPGTCYLNLGRVESLAKVRLNGKEVRTLWCYPYRVNVSDFLVPGENKLEVDIVNQWWNQLIGDEQPGAIRTTSVSARLFWKADEELVPSGLMGPVVLETIK